MIMDLNSFIAQRRCCSLPRPVRGCRPTLKECVYSTRREKAGSAGPGLALRHSMWHIPLRDWPASARRLPLPGRQSPGRDAQKRPSSGRSNPRKCARRPQQWPRSVFPHVSLQTVAHDAVMTREASPGVTHKLTEIYSSWNPTVAARMQQVSKSLWGTASGLIQNGPAQM